MSRVANYKHAYKEAEKVLALHKIDKAPVPIFNIVKNMGLELLEYDLGAETSGVLVVDKDKKVATIAYNPSDPQTRRRFTVAHELGHYLLHKKENELFVDSYFLMKYRGNNSYSPEEYVQEQEANAFAAALLIPDSFITDILRSNNFSGADEPELIDKLAAKFEVSPHAMTFRLSNLYLIKP